MTNLYNSSPRPRPDIVLIHGLNNNTASFLPLKEHLERRGWKVHFVPLPGHGEDKRKIKDLGKALQVFDLALQPLVQAPYSVITFSYGALYFQLWQDRHLAKRPLSQVLLAPAFYVRGQRFMGNIIRFLPSFIPIKSLSPGPFRRHQFITVAFYKILMEGLLTWQKNLPQFKAPTMLLIDPKDEIINAQKLEQKIKSRPFELAHFIKWPRPYLTKGIGRHHILFHPDYFSESDWQKFTDTIEEFLLAN